jgi:hypothetical protein
MFINGARSVAATSGAFAAVFAWTLNLSNIAMLAFSQVRSTSQ